MLKRIPHLLRPNKVSKFPKQIIFFDTETNQLHHSNSELEQQFKLGVACYYHFRYGKDKDTEEWLYFTKKDDFWNWVNKKCYQKKQLYLISHNIDFDFRVLEGFEALQQRNFKLVKLISNYQVKIWKFKRDKASLCLLDNLNYFNTSLENLGESIGITKLEMPSPSASKKKWFRYCQKDVEIIKTTWFLWLKFLKDEDLGCFGKTLASQSFNAFRHRFMISSIYIHNNKKVITFERESYKGARTECFQLGELKGGLYFYLDINAMYPFLMLNNSYPSRLIGYSVKSNVSNLKYWLERGGVIAKVKIKTDIPIYGVKMNNKLCFPIGSFETFLTTRELKIALERKHLKGVSEIAVYEMSFLFKDFVNYFYNRRLYYQENNNPSFAYLCKLILNSLYGKFGQKNDVWVKVADDSKNRQGVWEEWDMDKKKWHFYRCINYVVEEKVGEVEAFNSFPAISSHITSDARLLLWDYIEKAGQNNVLYCDTDSIFVNQLGFNNVKSFLSNKEMGKLKLIQSSDYLEIRNLKDYTFGSEIKIKGIKKNAERIDKNTFSQWNFESFIGGLRNNRLNKCFFVKVDKRLKNMYSKGIVLNSGKVIPFKL